MIYRSIVCDFIQKYKLIREIDKKGTGWRKRCKYKVFRPVDLKNQGIIKFVKNNNIYRKSANDSD